METALNPVGVINDGGEIQYPHAYLGTLVTSAKEVIDNNYRIPTQPAGAFQIDFTQTYKNVISLEIKTLLVDYPAFTAPLPTSMYVYIASATGVGQLGQLRISREPSAVDSGFQYYGDAAFAVLPINFSSLTAPSTTFRSIYNLYHNTRVIVRFPTPLESLRVLRIGLIDNNGNRIDPVNFNMTLEIVAQVSS